jgi:SAM-dependent methyltransferase
VQALFKNTIPSKEHESAAYWKHDFLLAEKGYAVTGMICLKKCWPWQTLNSQPHLSAPNSRLFHGDIRSVRLNKKFDAVISLFHVISYQNTNDDLKAAFETVKAHLRPGGIFIFDCWYGPAVLTEKPAVRIKRLEDDVISVTRIAEPVIRSSDNCVDVYYQVFVTDKETGRTESINERHSMRYLFMPEIESLFVENGITSLHAAEWMTGREASADTWGICVVGRING